MSTEISSNTPEIYHMVTATLEDDEVKFPSKEAFEEAKDVGFFRIKAPDDMNLKAGRAFAKTFTSTPKYQDFGVLDVANGYLQSDVAQTVRFTLERDNWDKCHIKGKVIPNGEPNYPQEIQELGHKMHEVGIKVLKYFLRRFEVPGELWFEGTGGAAFGEGSHYLLFNCYDPKNGASKSDGVGAHKDWSHFTILDAVKPGLEAKINGVWTAVHTEKGFLIINSGYPLKKLLPEVEAAEHRVVTQTNVMRTSTVAFIDPRVGPFRESSGHEGEGKVYDWDGASKQLVNPESTISFFDRLNEMLYGKNQEGSKE